MARKRVVSRTIPKLTAQIAVADMAHGTLVAETIDLPNSAKSPKSALKYAKEYFEKDPNKRAVEVVKIEKSDVHYEMPEEDFIKAAKVVQPKDAQPEQ